MKVKELLELLEDHDPTAEVMLYLAHESGYGIAPIGLGSAGIGWNQDGTVLLPADLDGVACLPWEGAKTTCENTDDDLDEVVPCGCPECAAESDSSGCDGICETVSALRELAKDGRLLVYDPDNRMLLSDDDIFGVCVNGCSVQVTLSPGWSGVETDDMEARS